MGTIDRNSLPYRPCVGIALFNHEGKVFAGERLDNPGAWQMPQGGINEGEDIAAAALRELKEEIGTNKATILKIADDILRYEIPDHLLTKLWGGRYRGQEQVWIAARFTGEDSDIVLDDDNHPEFSAWQWVAPEDTLDLIVSFKRDTYTRVIEMFEEFSDS